MAFLPSNSTYQKIELTADIVMYWPFYTPSGDITIADIMDVEASQAGWTIALPDASLSETGRNFIFSNISQYEFQVVLQDRITELTTIAAGEVKFINLTGNTTTNGTWSVIAFGGGQATITTVTAQSSDNSINITNGSLIPPGGVIDFALPQSLTNFNDIAAIGFPVIKQTAPMTFGTVELVSGENIVITNANGVSGEPVINLNNIVIGLSSLEVGDVTMSGSIITSNIANGNIDMVTNGTGKLNFNGVTVDTNNNIANVNDLTVNGKFSNPLMPSAWCVFTDTVTGSSNNIVNQASENIASITGSNGRYVLTFTNAMSSINYGVIITLGSNGSTLPPPVYHAFFTVRETTSATIAILDASGEFVQSFPDGVTVVVMSN
jgi:hypothetical protein